MLKKMLMTTQSDVLQKKRLALEGHTHTYRCVYGNVQKCI